MKKSLLLIIFASLLIAAGPSSAQNFSAETLLKTIESGPFKAGHIQGFAIDKKNQHIYYSYTNILIKTDMQGNILGSVTDLIGHLGDLAFNEQDGRLYGSLEYKDDAIGTNILKRLGKNDDKVSIGFYIAIFDTKKIDRENICSEKNDVMKTVHLKTVLDDYTAVVQSDGNPRKHRLACSGIDGVTFGPKFGKKGGKQYLTVAYGVYGDKTRSDNDHQVILQYDVRDWDKYSQLSEQDNLHHSGPDSPNGIYFVYTGNTNYGIQNLDYDSDNRLWWMSVYKGSKEQFPNYTLFAVDGRAKAKRLPLKGVEYLPTGNLLPLQSRIPSLRDDKTGIRGWNFAPGCTGFCHICDDLFYISHNYSISRGEGSDIRLYRLNGGQNKPFELVQ